MADTIETLIEDTDQRMNAALAAAEKEFAAIRTGKASPALVEGLMVDYYGSATRLRDIAGITTPEPRLLVIQPWDQAAVKSIEKAIQGSSLGISPVSDGRVIRLPIPELSEERRRDMIKQAKNRAEEARIEVRNIRRDANDSAKKAEKSSAITEDDLELMLAEIQDLTNKYISSVDRMLENKEQELLTI